jgi:hypothetical protein
MRPFMLLSTAYLALAAVGTRGEEAQPTAPQVDAVALEKRIADLERQLSSVQKELQDVRRELRAQAIPKVAALTPEQAVAAFKQNSKKLFTVEFGVESAGWPDGPTRVGDDPTPPIMADWDGRLSNGGKFTLLLTAGAIRGLKDIGIELPPAEPIGLVDLNRINLLCNHLKGKGVRVTGSIRANRPNERYTDYTIVVDDPAAFVVNK